MKFASLESRIDRLVGMVMVVGYLQKIKGAWNKWGGWRIYQIINSYKRVLQVIRSNNRY